MIRASQIHQARLCPGSVAAQEGIIEESSQAIALEGTAIHAAHHNPEKASKLTLVQMKVLQDQITARDKFVGVVLKGCDPATIQVHQEELLSQTILETEGITGHPDYIAIGTVNGTRIAAIPDFKTGWLDVPDPEANDQLRAYAVLSWLTYGVDEVFCTIIPRSGKSAIPVYYDKLALEMALNDIKNTLFQSSVPGAPRTPHPDACRYCKARATTRCPETLKRIDVVVSHEILPSHLLPADIPIWIEKCQEVKKDADKFLKRIEDLLEEKPDAIPGYALVPGGKKRSIEDASACYGLIENKVSVEEFSAIAKVSHGDVLSLLVTKLRAANPDLAIKDAQKQASQILEPVIAWKQNKPSLKKINQLEEAA